MKKNKKKHSKGFVLAETLVATIFVSAIFTIIFLNFYPLLGEYEKRENYDDIESVQKAFVLKMLFETNSTLRKDVIAKTKLNDLSKPYYNYSDWSVGSGFNKDAIKTNLQIEQAIITSFSVDDLKLALDETNSTLFKDDPDFKEYIYYINSYSAADKIKTGDDVYNYRLIVKFKNTYKEFKNDTSNDTYYSYANLEVDLK